MSSIFRALSPPPIAAQREERKDEKRVPFKFFSDAETQTEREPELSKHKCAPPPPPLQAPLPTCTPKPCHYGHAFAESSVEFHKAAMAAAATKEGLDAVDSRGWTKLMIAVEHADFEAAAALVESGCDVDIENTMISRTALMLAAERGHDKLVELLLTRGDVNKQNSSGMTALMLAARQTRLSTVKLLVAHDSHLNTKDAFGRTALMHATETGQTTAVTFLLGTGACDIDATDAEGLTAFIMAARFGHPQIVRALLKAGCKTDTENTYRWAAKSAATYFLELQRASRTPDSAIIQGYIEVLKILDGK